MATCIVEESADWCSRNVQRILAENGYQLTAGTGPSLEAEYVGRGTAMMFPRPRVLVDVAPLSCDTTKVTIDSPVHWVPFCRRAIIWNTVGWTPFLATLLVRATVAANRTHATLWALATALTACWMFFCIVFEVALKANIRDAHVKKMERLLWTSLTSRGVVPHGLDGSSHAERRVWEWLNRGSLCVLIAGCLLLLTSSLLPPYDATVLIQRHSRASLATVLFFSLGSIFQAPLGRWLGVLAFVSGGLMLTVSSWVVASVTLPHRYHWKARFYGTYLLWGWVVGAPSLLMFGRMMLQVMPSTGSQSMNAAGFVEDSCFVVWSLLTWAILVTQLVCLACVLRLLPEHEEARRDDYYAPPSAKYEALSQCEATEPNSRAVGRFRFWTWATFPVLTVLFYMAVLSLSVITVEATSAVLGAESKAPWAWPRVVHMDGGWAAAQAIVLACVMGMPLCVATAQAIGARRRIRRMWHLGWHLSTGQKELVLPHEPLNYLQNVCGMDSFHVALAPLPWIDVRIEKVGLLQKRYLMWVSHGARGELTAEELEALMWHECHHVDFVNRMWWREWTALLAPWAPRFLDISLDLYDEEQYADVFTVRHMGTSLPLRSALLKVQAAMSKWKRDGARRVVGKKLFRPGSANALRMLSSLAWAAYLHPDVDQRLRWIDEMEKQACLPETG